MSIFKPGERELTGSFYGEPEREAEAEPQDHKDHWWANIGKKDDDDE